MSGGNLNLKALGSFVTASIVSGCIIPPLFQSFWQVSADKGLGLLAVYHNSLYMNAAVGNRNWIDYIVLTILIAVITLVPVALLFSYLFLRTAGRKKRNTAVASTGLRTTVGLALAPLLLINGLAGFIVLNYAFADLQLNGSFEQYIRAIGPSLSEAEEKELRSKWALMETEEDCRKIFEQIQIKGQTAGINLPKKLYF